MAVTLPIRYSLLTAEASETTENQKSSPIFCPYYDEGRTTRKLCILGLILSWCIAICFIVLGILNTTEGWVVPMCWEPGKDLLVLAQNVLITCCNESLGYIHSVSLRWTLQREGRLYFNSNLRLLQNTHSTGPNAWYSNTVMTLAIVATYGASSLTLCPMSSGDCIAFRIVGAAWIILGCSIAAQACVATWAICSQSGWPTWSSNMMDVAAACIDQRTRPLSLRAGRAMQGIDLLGAPTFPTSPAVRQPSAYHSHRQARRITWPNGVGVALLSVYTCGLFIYPAKMGLAETFKYRQFWNPTGWSFPAVVIPLSDEGYQSAGAVGIFLAKDFAWIFALLCGIQSLVTFTLHLAELCIYTARDETIWRKASKKTGQKRTSNALLALLSSYQTAILFLLKPFAHWLYGLTFVIDIYNGVSLFAAPAFYLTIVVSVFLAFSLALMLWRHSGPQPTTFGHLQTLVDLIDTWPARRDRLHWGDKGAFVGHEAYDGHAEIRHAGTHWLPLPAVQMDKRYA